MASNVLFLYSTVDGHTLEICERLATVLEAEGLVAKIEEIRPGHSCDAEAYSAMVVGASIRYGKHRPEVARFIEDNRACLESTPSAFFSVNAVARKPDKRTPESNPYVRKFLESISWQPGLIGIFAGKIDYPSYRFFDRHMIRLIMWITKGPTDLHGTFEFTDWAAVDDFGREVAARVKARTAEPQ